MAGAKRMFIHVIEVEEITKNFPGSSKMNGTWRFLMHLFELGRMKADQWLIENFDALGSRSSVDLRAKYL
jgi:NTE family protein